MSGTRPNTPEKSISIDSKDDLTALIKKYEAPNSAGGFLLACTPPIDAIRTFWKAFADLGELATDLTAPRHIETLPGGVRISARSAIRGLRDESTMWDKAAFGRKVEAGKINPLLRGGR